MRLLAITPDGTERPLTLLPGGEYRIGATQSAEMRRHRYFAP